MDDEQAQQRRAIANAIREGYTSAGLTQAEVAQRVGLTQAYLSKYVNGVHEPSLWFLLAFDEAIGAPRGSTLRRAKLIDTVDVPTAIAASDLEPDVKDALQTIYRHLATKTPTSAGEAMETVARELDEAEVPRRRRSRRRLA